MRLWLRRLLVVLTLSLGLAWWSVYKDAKEQLTTQAAESLSVLKSFNTQSFMGREETLQTGLMQNTTSSTTVPIITSSTLPMQSTTRPNTKKVTLVLLSTMKDKDGFPRLAGALASLAAFAKPGSIHELLMVVPDKELATFNDSLVHNGDKLWEVLRTKDSSTTSPFVDIWQRKKSFPVRIVTDSEVLPTSMDKLHAEVPRAEKELGGRGAHYRVQMMVKLGVAIHVQTAFYVTIDSDVYAKRPFGYDDLVTKEGRGRIQGEQIFGKTQHRVDWWDSASRALDAKKCVTKDDNTIGVTPAVLSTVVHRAMLEQVYAVHGKSASWDLLLFRLLTRGYDWSEYTLHFTAACKAGLLKKIFDAGKTELYDYSGFSFSSFSPEIIKHSFGHGAIFGLVQSISGTSPNRINTVLLPLITKER